MAMESGCWLLFGCGNWLDSAWENFVGDENVLQIDCDVVYVYQNSVKWMLKICKSHIM